MRIHHEGGHTNDTISYSTVLLGDAAQHQSSLWRKEVMKHLNPQLQTLMKVSDFKAVEPFLFGEDFGEKAKAKMEAAAVLKKAVSTNQGGFLVTPPSQELVICPSCCLPGHSSLTSQGLSGVAYHPVGLSC